MIYTVVYFNFYYPSKTTLSHYNLYYKDFKAYRYKKILRVCGRSFVNFDPGLYECIFLNRS
jgi:hypothetical protein